MIVIIMMMIMIITMIIMCYKLNDVKYSWASSSVHAKMTWKDRQGAQDDGLVGAAKQLCAKLQWGLGFRA